MASRINASARVTRARMLTSGARAHGHEAALVGGGLPARARRAASLRGGGRRAAAVLAPLQLFPRRAGDRGAPAPAGVRAAQRPLAPVAGAVDDRAALLPDGGRLAGRPRPAP